MGEAPGPQSSRPHTSQPGRRRGLRPPAADGWGLAHLTLGPVTLSTSQTVAEHRALGVTHRAVPTSTPLAPAPPAEPETAHWVGGGEGTAQETPRLGSGGEGPPPLAAPSPAHGLLEGLVRWQLERRQGTPMPCAEGTLHTRLGQGPGDGRCPQHSPSELAGGSHGRPNCPLGPGCGPGITWPCRVTNQTLDAQWAE